MGIIIEIRGFPKYVIFHNVITHKNERDDLLNCTKIEHMGETGIDKDREIPL